MDSVASCQRQSAVICRSKQRGKTLLLEHFSIIYGVCGGFSVVLVARNPSRNKASGALPCLLRTKLPLPSVPPA